MLWFSDAKRDSAASTLGLGLVPMLLCCCALWKPKRNCRILVLGRMCWNGIFSNLRPGLLFGLVFFFSLTGLSKVIKVQTWGGRGRAAQCALTCFICTCENTLLYKGLLLVSHICGEKRCEIWSMFQEKTVGSFYLRAMQGWPLAMLWTLCSRLQSEANAPREGG